MTGTKRYFYFVISLMLLMAATAVACDGGGEPSTPQAAIYEALLGTIPDIPETRNDVYIADYTLARQVFDAATFPLPGPGDDEDAVAAFTAMDWLPPLGTGYGDYPFILGLGSGFFDQVIYGQYTRQMAENFQHLALDIRNIDQSIAAGPPNQAHDVVRGRFDPQAADAALKACTECPAPDLEEHRGVPYYSWGEDYAVDRDMVFAPPAFDYLGRGGRIAVLDEYVFRTVGTSEMEGLIDAHLNEAPSLADVEEFRILAGGMSKLRAYTMLLSDKIQLWGLSNHAKALAGQDASQAEIEAKERELAESGFWLRSYQEFGVGACKDEEGPHMALALVHADGASAKENVGRLRGIIEEGSSTFYNAPWSDDIDVDSLEINAEGRLLIAKLRGDIIGGDG